MHYLFKVGYLGSSPSGVTILTQKMMLYNKKKEGISQGEKAFIVLTLNNEGLRARLKAQKQRKDKQL